MKTIVSLMFSSEDAGIKSKFIYNALKKAEIFLWINQWWYWIDTVVIFFVRNRNRHIHIVKQFKWFLSLWGEKKIYECIT